ncbi:DUF3772 domain-containing protein [Pseudogemmobacter sonorensis]|uniref:DUF3772 domain-containing protein n=1 Tax=Pseudogemmobacter sonorensis TaxID=2989681 RepID=UPI00368592D7
MKTSRRAAALRLRLGAGLRILGLAFWLGLLGLMPGPMLPGGSGAALAQSGAETAAESPAPVDYQVWEDTAARAEAALADNRITSAQLDALRAEIALWRTELSSALSANSARIATVREQIAALGPAPEEGQTEAAEIATKRLELADLLGRLQAPGLAADEAYRRADGLIREIDRILRERQADRLLQLWPSPLNPANWDDAAVAVGDTAIRIWDEASGAWADDRTRQTFLGNLPLILLLLALAGSSTILGRRWIEILADRLHARGSEARQRVFSFLASIGQVVVPTLGAVALSTALILTGIPGDIIGAIARALPFLGLTLFLSIWLGGRAFPRVEEDAPILPLPVERRAEGRFLAAMMGLVVVWEALRAISMGSQAYANAVTSVASFPILCAGGLLLWRTGRLLKLASQSGGAGQAASYALKLTGLLGQGCVVLGIVGPLLAAFGYVAAAKALVFPAMLSLGLLMLLLVLQELLSDLWAMVARLSDAESGEGLVPVLIGLVLTLLSLPLFALIWGARLSDLTELWTRFREGFQMGETRISPTDFIVFAVIFVAGYMVTRLLQGTLRSTILPRTRMERGGQNALVSGMGYVGIFLSALLAFNATGIDLSGLAIFASALSVGIGFGLQNIVQNFVSGIILMIERPVSEGDWIEVGTTQGIVKVISVRSTRIQTFDRNVVLVPNSDLISQRVTNWTRFSLAGRLIVPVAVALGQDSRRVEAILREIAEAQPMVVLNPPPAILLQSFGSGALNFEMRLILRDVNFSGGVRNDINHLIVQRFAEEGIEMPSTSAEITLGNPDDLGRAFAAPGLSGGLSGGLAEARPTGAASSPSKPADGAPT